jgi:Putative prokaryotic signal transducing protein
MRELLRSNDLVHLSWAQAALSSAGIESVVLDTHVSGVEGNIGAFPRRLMVADDLLERAREVLARAAQALARG